MMFQRSGAIPCNAQPLGQISLCPFEGLQVGVSEDKGYHNLGSL